MKEEKLTKFIKTEDANQKWYIVDASEKILGRLASEVAKIIRGKNKPTFTPNMDTGDFVIVVNAEKINVTGKRAVHKTYFSHSGYPGGVRIQKYSELKDKNPEFVIRNAVKGMLPKNRIGRKLINKLKVYSGSEHPHTAQKPEVLNI